MRGYGWQHDDRTGQFEKPMEATVTGKELITKLAVPPRFWVLLIVALTGVYFYVRGEITADVLAGMITALALFVVGAVTLENKVKADNAAKIQMNRDTANAQVASAEKYAAVESMRLQGGQ